MNVMWCLSPVSPENGAMECVPWDVSLALFSEERAATREKLAELTARDRQSKREHARGVISEYYRASIDHQYKERIVQPHGDSGLVFAFSNNTLHKGGYPTPGHVRYVCVFHIYPSDRPTPFERYSIEGIGKGAPFPLDPAFGD
jgi:hypothetical protein